MSVGETNTKYCVHHEDEIIKTEAVEGEQANDTLLISAKFKRENGPNDSSKDQFSELNNLENPFPSSCIKKEPEDWGADEVHQVQAEAENSQLKEEIDIVEHKPGGTDWGSKLIGGTSDVGILKDELDPCDSVEGNANHFLGSKNRCPFTTNQKNNNIDRYNRKHKFVFAIYKCNECSYETGIKSKLVRHFKYGHSKRPAPLYKCAVCAFETIENRYLTAHYKCKHAKETEPLYKCEECPYSTRFKHFKYKHAKEAQVFKCEECSFETKHKNNLTKHYKCKHSTEALLYKCKECSYKTRIKVYLVNHIKRKHSIRAQVYKCEECAFETSEGRYLTAHYKRKHAKETEPLYKCEECPYGARFQHDLNKHFKYRVSGKCLLVSREHAGEVKKN